jgi:hypothetical protein
MKKLLILTAVLALTGSLSGCHCLDWMCRGGRAEQPCTPAPTMTPAYNPCDPCAGGGAPAGVLTPGPASYAPGAMP